VLAAALVLLALLGGITGTTVGLVLARASAKAERAARNAEAEERRKAREAEAELNRGRLQLSQKIAIVQTRLAHQKEEVDRRKNEFTRLVKLGGRICVSQDEFNATRQRWALEKAKRAALDMELFQLVEAARRQGLPGLDEVLTPAASNSRPSSGPISSPNGARKIRRPDIK
jgi:hypothetical protein